MLRSRVWQMVLVVGVWGLWVVPVKAGEAAAEESPAANAAEPSEATKVADSAEIERLITELDADQFEVRQRAAKRLTETGSAAIDALAKAAVGESLEVTTRAIDVLKKLYQSDDEATKKAAEAALEKLAQGGHAPSAWRARSVLKAKLGGDTKAEDPNQPVQPGRIIFGGNIVPGIQVQQIAKARSVSVSKRDGVKEIKVQEDDKRYHITVDDKKGIKVEMLKKNKEGKEVAETIEAKDAEELKKKNEEAYKVFKEYGEQDVAGGVIQVQIGGAVPVPAPNIVPAAPRRTQLDVLPRLIQSIIQSIGRIADEDAINSAPQESIDELKKSLDDLKGRIAEIEKLIKTREEKPARPAPEKADPSAKPAEDRPAANTPSAARDKPETE